VNRFIEEVGLYTRSVRRFQYHVTDEDLEVAMKALPVEPTGVSTDPFEVSNYRYVPGIETNRLRGGAPSSSSTASLEGPENWWASVSR